MPIYEYKCQGCGHAQEVMQGINDKPLTTCPMCKKRQYKKLVSAPGFQLKGTGWYVTDFKNSNKKEPVTDAAPEKKAVDDKKASDKPATADKAAKAQDKKSDAGSSATS